MLLVDEIDKRIGDTLLAVVRHLRAGYHHCPASFPQSVSLCGVHDVRDCRIHFATAGAQAAGGSAFDVKAASLRLDDSPRRRRARCSRSTRPIPDESGRRRRSGSCGI